MPAVLHKILSISCLTGDDERQLKEQWKTRFSKHETCFLEAQMTDTWQNTVENLCAAIEKQGLAIGADSCILAFFLDLRQDVDAAWLHCIEEGLKALAICKIEAVVQFGYIGKWGFQTPTMQRENAHRLVESNRKSIWVPHRLCLTASPYLSTVPDNNWKAVCVFLDIQSRKNSAIELLPGNGNGYVGFLRYGEYDQVRCKELQKKHAALMALLGDGGQKEFMAELKKRDTELSNKAAKRFQIEGNAQPLHPDMAKTRPGMFPIGARKKWEKAFEKARVNSQLALERTAEQLEKDIRAFFAPIVSNARSDLETLMDKNRLGYGFRQNPDRMRELLVAPPIQQKPLRPALDFNEVGYSQDICDYLEGVRDWAISQQLQVYYRSLCESSAALAVENLKEKVEKLEEQVSEVVYQLEKISTPDSFCGKYAFGKIPPECSFTPAIGNAETCQFLLCGGDLAEQVNGYTAAAPTLVYSMPGAEPDDAPLKAVQVVFLQCTNAEETKGVLLQLLPEVIG